MRRTALAALAALALAACEDRELHVFGGQRFDPEGQCLEEAGVVDVVEGPDRGPCDAPRCWQAPDGEIFVTTSACDAPPDYADETGDAPNSACAMALEALANRVDCATQASADRRGRGGSEGSGRAFWLHAALF